MTKSNKTKYYIYLARCRDKSIYTGYTLDVKEREVKHNAGEGAKFTRGRLPLKIVYSESFNTITKAMRREMEIKKWPRAKKEELIKSKMNAKIRHKG